MEINFVWLFFELLIAVFILGPLIYAERRKASKKDDIAKGERYSNLDIIKSIERNERIIYYLGDEKNQIEVPKEDYDYAIKTYQESVHKNEG